MKYLLFFIIPLVTCISCSKKESGNVTDNPPANLEILADISNDNSGNVSFTATASNAVVYLFDFGDGAKEVSATGKTTHKYSASAVYTVNVTAKNSTNQSITKSIVVNISMQLSLVWSDEFEATGAPDPAKWTYDLGAGGWGNNELEYYTNRSENVSISGGTLKITAKREAYSGSDFTSARILTKGKFAFKYGKIEVRAKLPSGIGTWPAIWMLGNNIASTPWPACGEIDIMEHVGKQQNVIYGTLHHPGHSGANGDGATVTIANASTAFHTYSMEWNAASIKFSVDGTVFYNFANSPTLPFNQDFFIILNVAMGGNFAGAVDPAFTGSTMEIDYVRVYQ